MDFGQKRKLKRFLYSRTMLVVLLILFVFISRATWNVYKKAELSKANLEFVTKDVTKLKERQVALTAQINKLNTEQGIEAEIRQKFRVAKEGEQIAVIVDDETDIPVATTTAEKSIWQKILGIFVGEDK